MDFIIYKLVCNSLNVNCRYVGYTANFTKRKYSHKNASINETNKNYNDKIYQIIRDNGGWYNWSMIELCHCKNKEEARARQRYYCELLKADMNIRCAGRSKKEYLEQTKEQKKQYDKIYYQQHKEQKKEYYQQHKEQKKEYYEQNKKNNLPLKKVEPK